MVSFSTISKRLLDIRLRCEHSAEAEKISFAHFQSVFKIPVAHWAKLVGRDEVMMTAPFLAALEQHPIPGLQFHYLLAYSGTEPIAALYFQEFELRISNVSNNVDTDKINDARSLMGSAKDVLVKGFEQIGVRLLVLGNVYMSGQYGVRIFPDMTAAQTAEVIEAAIERIMKNKLSGKKIRTILLKDLPDDLFDALHAKDDDLIPFHIQPQMVLPLRDWTTMNDYMDALASKYRQRAKSAFNKFERISKRELSLDDLQRLEPEMWSLYQEVEGKADFVLASVPKGYFIDLKMAIDTRYRVVGYFDGDKLVGFYSTLLSKECNIAHYIGLDYELNKECSLYLNILYHQIADAIADSVKTLDTGRTALEIKSTVGCEPQQLRLLAKHTNGITNSIVKRFLQNLKQPEWIQRRPFKDAVEVEV